MQKKEKEPIFTQMEFDNAQYAMDIKTGCEAKLARVKLGLIIAAVAEVAWVLIFVIHGMPRALGNILEAIALIGTVAAYIVGGGLAAAFRLTWKIAKTIGWFGWFCCPFPIDIVTGLLLTILAICEIPLSFILLPLLLVFCNYVQVNKDYKAAVDYLSYCRPVNDTNGGNTVVCAAQVQTWICPGCGKEVDAGGRFCPACGTPKPEEQIEQTKSFCPSCGSKLETGIAFCPKCGKKIL